jgi:hypothetical protein
MHVYMYLCMWCVCMSSYLYISLHVCMCVYKCVLMCVCIYECIHVCLHMSDIKSNNNFLTIFHKSALGAHRMSLIAKETKASSFYRLKQKVSFYERGQLLADEQYKGSLR